MTGITRAASAGSQDLMASIVTRGAVTAFAAVTAARAAVGDSRALGDRSTAALLCTTLTVPAVTREYVIR